MHEGGKSCYWSLPKLKEFLAFPSKQINLEALKAAYTEGSIPIEGVFIEEEEDPLE